MKISRNNYESWFLDYHEGRLDKEMIRQVELFLLRNPDLKEELSRLSDFRLMPPETRFPGKEKLFKEKYDCQELFDETAAALYEGDLSQEEAADFEKYLTRRPERREEATLFEKTRLSPDPNLVFSNKKLLKKQPAIFRIERWSLRVAAIFLAALLIYTLAEKSPLLPEKTGKTAGITSGEIQKINEDNRSGSSLSHHQKPTDQDTDSHYDEVSLKSDNSPRPDVAFNFKTERKPSDSDPGKNDILTRENSLVPELILPLQATLVHDHETITLATLSPGIEQETAEKTPGYGDDQKPLTERLIEMAGLSDLSLARAAQWGLSAASEISGERLNFRVNESGQITNLNLNTRLLGLSIPVRKER